MPWISKNNLEQQKKDFERTLSESKECQQILSLLPTPVMAIDRDFTVTFMNPTGAKLLGKTREQCVGKKCYNLFNTDHCNTDKCGCARAMREDKTVTTETIAGKGTLDMPIQYTGSPLKNESGKIVGALEYVVDFTETKRAMDIAQQSVNNLINLPTPVMTIDRDFGVTFMNKAGTDLLGETGESVKGKKCYNLFKTTHCNTEECRCNQAMRRDGIFYGETYSNGTLPIGYTGAPIKDGNGKIVGALEFVTDMTEIKNAQKKTEEIAAFQTMEVEKLANILQKMGEGDLTDSYKVARSTENTSDVAKAFDNIATNLNQTLDSLNDILGQVNTAVDQVTSGAEQVSDASQSLSQGATEQASSLEEITATMVEVGTQVKTNSENAQQANNLATEARDGADTGNDQMQQMVRAMGEINESSKEIGRIIKVIDEIAFQTNLLALNAAVEAARAGVHGKGFAVVAEEVRNLAQRSAKAAKETTELIEGSTRKVENGASIANQTEKALADIVNSINKVTDLVKEIAIASNEQNLSIDQINQSLSQIEEVTQGNTSNAEESASAAEELSGQGIQLKQMVNQFTLRDFSNNSNNTSKYMVASSQKKNGSNNGKKQTKVIGSQNIVDPSEIITLDDDNFNDF